MPHDPLTTRRPAVAPLATAVTALVAVAAPLVLLAFNRDWVVTSGGLIDPWHYVGFFHEYWNPDYGLGSYKVARLPWVLSGAFAWRILSPLPAAYVLHLSYFCAMTLATFVGVRYLFGQNALAAVVALCLGFYTHAHGSGGWDYHNTAAGAFYMATFAALASPGAAAGRRGAMLIAGVLAGLTVHSNVTLVNFLPALALVHLHIAWRAGSRVTLRAIAARTAWAFVGVLAITIALALVNWSAGRHLLFFSELVDKVVSYLGTPGNQVPFRLAPGWYYTAVHLSLPAAVFLMGAAMLAWRRDTADPDRRLALSLILQFLCMSLIWGGWQAAGQTALDWDYFAYALVPSCFVAIAGLLKLAWRDQYERYALLVALGTAAAFALALSGGVERAVVPIEATFGRFMMPAAAVVFAFAFALVFARPAAALPAFVIVFALANRLAAPGAQDRYAMTDRCKTQPQIYEAIVDAAAWLSSIDPTNMRIRTWFDERDHITFAPNACGVGVGDIGQSVTAMAFTGQLVDPATPGEISQGAIEAAMSDSESILAVIADSDRSREIWDMRLGSLGLTRHELASHRVRLGDATFIVDAWMLEQPPPEAVVFGPPVLTIDMPHDASRVEAIGPPVIAPHARITRPPAAIRTDAGSVWARLRVKTSEGIAPCRVVLQNDKLERLVSAACASGTKYVLLPAQTPTISVTVENTSWRPAPMPALIEVSVQER